MLFSINPIFTVQGERIDVSVEGLDEDGRLSAESGDIVTLKCSATGESSTYELTTSSSSCCYFYTTFLFS